MSVTICGSRSGDLPLAVRVTGTVAGVRDLSPSVAELVVELRDRLPWIPGQSVKLSFAGAERDYCPTFGLRAEAHERTLVFHVRRHPAGAFSGRLGTGLRSGARVGVYGPFGREVLRHGEGRLVLVSAGTGFAPVWAMAVAARLGQPHRPLTVVVAARDPRDLYMRPALAWLRARGIGDVRVVARDAGTGDLFVQPGRPAEVLPDLGAGDVVHVAGAPSDVMAVAARAAAAGAQCHALPFADPAALRPSQWETVVETGPRPARPALDNAPA
jgi:3-phenylpropionate/trans-cinnamate dioxygenase ferredoxin reductase subunit